jgi:UDP-2,3-diacylglucosamine pyrophosphatase LpxH
MNEASIPTNFSEITVDFLNKVLIDQLKSRIKSFSKGKEIEPGFTGEVIRILLSFEDNNECLPKSLIIKFQTSNPGINAFMTKIHGYENEIKIYQILSSITELNLPKIYYTSINEEGSKYIIIMEDLNEKGYIKVNNEKPFDMKIFKLIVEYFSKLQANFWGKKKLKSIEWIKNSNFGEYMKTFTTLNFDKKKKFFIENNKNLLNNDTTEIIKNIKIEQLFELINPYNKRNENNITLLHGDPQCNNLLINEKKESMVMIDWQYINIGLGLKDVILFIGIMLDENNIKTEDIIQLKNLYFDSLVKNGVKTYERERYDEDWKNLTILCLCNIISASAEENIGDDIEKKEKYNKHILTAEKRFITFIQKQKL